MDNCLTMFSEQLDVAFKPETLFPGKKMHTMGWIRRQFAIRKKQVEENLLVNNIAEAVHAQLAAPLS